MKVLSLVEKLAVSKVYMMELQSAAQKVAMMVGQ